MQLLTTLPTALALLACTVSASPLSAVPRNNDGGSGSGEAPTLRPINATMSSFDFNKIEYIFAFGDSYTETGYNVSNGIDSVDPEKSTFSQGPTWITYLSSIYNTSSIRLFNLAISGATVDNDIVRQTALPFGGQLEQWNENFASHPESAPWTSENTLFVSWYGINDVGTSFGWTNVSLPELYTNVTNRYESLLLSLHSSGARNFLLLDIPPTNRAPVFVTELGEPYPSQVRPAVGYFNDALGGMIERFKATVGSGGWVGKFEASRLFTTVLDNADALGFFNVTSNYDPATSTVPRLSYFWSNDYHPTSSVHDILGHAVSTFLALAK